MADPAADGLVHATLAALQQRLLRSQTGAICIAWRASVIRPVVEPRPVRRVPHLQRAPGVDEPVAACFGVVEVLT